MPYLSAVRRLRPGALGQAYSVAGHIADNFRDFEEVPTSPVCRKAMCAAGLDACRAYMVEHAGEAFSGVGGANEYSLGLGEFADLRCFRRWGRPSPHQ